MESEITFEITSGDLWTVYAGAKLAWAVFVQRYYVKRQRAKGASSADLSVSLKHFLLNLFAGLELYILRLPVQLFVCLLTWSWDSSRFLPAIMIETRRVVNEDERRIAASREFLRVSGIDLKQADDLAAQRAHYTGLPKRYAATLDELTAAGRHRFAGIEQEENWVEITSEGDPLRVQKCANMYRIIGQAFRGGDFHRNPGDGHSPIQ